MLKTFKDFDEWFRYSYRKDRLEIANAYGYDSVSEATAALYVELGSVMAVAEVFGMTGGAISNELRKMRDFGVFTGLKPRGGPNFKGHKKKKEEDIQDDG